MRRRHDDLVSQASLAEAAPPKRSRTKRSARISPERRSKVARRRRRGAIRCAPRAGKSSVGARGYSGDVGRSPARIRACRKGPRRHGALDETRTKRCSYICWIKRGCHLGLRYRRGTASVADRRTGLAESRRPRLETDAGPYERWLQQKNGARSARSSETEQGRSG